MKTHLYPPPGVPREMGKGFDLLSRPCLDDCLLSLASFSLLPRTGPPSHTRLSLRSSLVLQLVLPCSVRLTRTANVTETAGRRGQEEPSTARTAVPAEVLRHPARLGISLGLLPRAPLLFPWGKFRSRRHTAGISSTLSEDLKTKGSRAGSRLPGSLFCQQLTRNRRSSKRTATCASFSVLIVPHNGAIRWVSANL